MPNLTSNKWCRQVEDQSLAPEIKVSITDSDTDLPLCMEDFSNQEFEVINTEHENEVTNAECKNEVTNAGSGFEVTNAGYENEVTNVGYKVEVTNAGYGSSSKRRFEEETIESDKRLKQDVQADMNSSSSSGKMKRYLTNVNKREATKVSHCSEKIHQDLTSHRNYNGRQKEISRYPLVEATEQPQVAILLRDIHRFHGDINSGIPNYNQMELQLELIQSKQGAEQAKQIFIFKPNFFEMLTDGAPPGTIRYDAVKNLTNKVDLFSKTFLIFPIRQKNPIHWYLAIVANPGLLLGSSEGEKEQQVLQGVSPTTATVTTTVVTTTPAVTTTVVTETPTSKTTVITTGPTVTTTVVTIRSEPTTPATVPTQGTGSGSVEWDVHMDDVNARPFIVILDSTVGATHPLTMKALRSYLEHELKEVKHIARPLNADTVVGKDAK
ncbi:Polypeptide N-acetylgalactosaminyltransferase 11, partial [Linnemannia exigua]